MGHRFFFLIKAHYPQFYYGQDLYGHPIYIEHVGREEILFCCKRGRGDEGEVVITMSLLGGEG